jgi:hypothetical protein
VSDPTPIPDELDMGALPENVLPIRQAATDGGDGDMR